MSLSQPLLDNETLSQSTDNVVNLAAWRVRLRNSTGHSDVECNVREVNAAGLVVEAMGIRPESDSVAEFGANGLADGGCVRVERGYRTVLDSVYAAGGIINGGDSLARCVAEGIAAADRIHRDLKKT